MKKLITISSILLLLGSTSGLTTMEAREIQFGDLILEGDGSIEYETPDWFAPTSLELASEDASYRIDTVLPYTEDRDEEIYIVIPQLGVVAPIVQIAKDSSDYTDMVSGRQIDFLKYLKDGVLEYTNSVVPGTMGKLVHFGHNTRQSSATGRYKTIFGTIMRLEPNDEIRYFVRSGDAAYSLHKYVIESSFNTAPNSVEYLQYDREGSDATLFTSTYGNTGRRIVSGTLKEQGTLVCASMRGLCDCESPLAECVYCADGVVTIKDYIMKYMQDNDVDTWSREKLTILKKIVMKPMADIEKSDQYSAEIPIHTMDRYIEYVVYKTIATYAHELLGAGKACMEY